MLSRVAREMVTLGAISTLTDNARLWLRVSPLCSGTRVNLNLVLVLKEPGGGKALPTGTPSGVLAGAILLGILTTALLTDAVYTTVAVLIFPECFERFLLLALRAEF